MTHTYCCVYSAKTPDEGQKTCLKHVEFYSKNKFEELVHLVGFITRIVELTASIVSILFHLDFSRLW